LRRSGGEVGFDGLADPLGDAAAALARGEEGHVLFIGEVAGLEQHRGHVRRLQHDQRGEAVIVGWNGDERRGLAVEESCEGGRWVIDSRWARSIRIG
jgi:hypothetical protein